jgi:hypothetical protein
MKEILNWLLDGKLLAGAVVGGLVSVLLREMFRARGKRRLLMGPAMLPSFKLATKDGLVTLTMFGDYGIVNMSELPINLMRPILMGYNAASRGFQFNVGSSANGIDDLLKDIQVPPSSECVLISQKSCTVGIERFCVRAVPTFIWLETIQRVRIGSRQEWRWRARLYRADFYSPKGNEAWYVNTGLEVSATAARLLALPGKLLTRHRWTERSAPP